MSKVETERLVAVLQNLAKKMSEFPERTVRFADLRETLLLISESIDVEYFGGAAEILPADTGSKRCPQCGESEKITTLENRPGICKCQMCRAFFHIENPGRGR